MSRVKATLKVDSIAAYTKSDKKVVIDWDLLDGDKELQGEELSSAFLFENLETFLDAMDCQIDNVKSLLGKTVTAKLYKNKNNTWLVDPPTIKVVDLNSKSETETKAVSVDGKQVPSEKDDSSLKKAADAVVVYDEAAANSARLLNKYLHDTIKHIKVLLDKGLAIDDVGRTLIKLHLDASYLEYKLNSLKNKEE